MTISLPTSIPGIYVLEGAGATVATDATLTGDGSGGSPLGLAAPVAINKGGTNAITAAAALANLGGVGAGKIITDFTDNGGDIAISATSFGTAIQAGFGITTVVPTGSKAIALLVLSGKSASGTTLVVGIDVDGAVSGVAPQIGGGVAGAAIPMTALAVLTGDGASHVFTPQAWKAGATNCTVLNSGNQDPAMLVVLIVPAT